MTGGWPYTQADHDAASALGGILLVALLAVAAVAVVVLAATA